MMIEQLKPVEIIRDENGQWSHPDYVKYLSENFGNAEWIDLEDWNEMLRHFNIQVTKLWLSASVSEDDFEQMMDSGNISKWQPIAPTGFFLMDIYFSEDDAYALFAREISEDSEVA